MNQTQWILLFLLIFIINKVWKDNLKKKSKEEAPVGGYSDASSYVNITAMKHDIFKQFTLDIMPFLLINSFNSEEFFSIDKFENTVVGKTLLSAVAFGLYYQIIQPHLINKIPYF